MAVGLEVLAKAEFARDAAEQRAGLKVDALRRRQRLSIGITIDLRQVVASIGSFDSPRLSNLIA
jgi:hypothetical protein